MKTSELKVNRPEPIKWDMKIFSFKREIDVKETINVLLAGRYVLIEGFFSNGLLLLKELRTFLLKIHPNESFKEQRLFRSEYRKLSNLILVQIIEHKLMLKKAPKIGWFKKLYPETNDFLLPFPQVQGLNSAWQWFSNGLVIPVLRNKVYPFYGVYFPTRFEHLQLFDHWLKHYVGPKKTAIDVGIGSGVLSMLLMKHGFQKSFGTDLNPNAIIGLNESMEGTKLSRKIEIDYGDLFAKWYKLTELIVFNPPWLPTSEELSRLDEAVYYNDKLFPAFFEEAKKRLLPEGRIVLLFSNLGQISNLTIDHPIEQELQYGGRFRLEKCYKRSVKAASEKTTRNQHWRSAENVELWVLRHV